VARFVYLRLLAIKLKTQKDHNKKIRAQQQREYRSVERQAPHLSAAFFYGAQLDRLQLVTDEAELMSDDEQREKDDRQNDAHSQRSNHAFRPAFVFPQEVKRGEQTHQDDGDEE
jgi:hypothetical protein